MRDEKLAKGEEYLGWRVHLPTTWFFGCQYAAMVLVSWVVSQSDTITWHGELMVDLLCLFGIEQELNHDMFNILLLSFMWRYVRPGGMILWLDP